MSNYNLLQTFGNIFEEGRHLAFLLGSPNILYSNYQGSCLIREQDSGRLVWIQNQVRSLCWCKKTVTEKEMATSIIIGTPVRDFGDWKEDLRGKNSLDTKTSPT
jgi:hypothetical protein